MYDLAKGSKEMLEKMKLFFAYNGTSKKCQLGMWYISKLTKIYAWNAQSPIE